MSLMRYLGRDSNIIPARWQAGLLRGGQAYLIEIALRKMMLQLETLILGVETDNEEVRRQEMARTCYRAILLMAKLIAGARFRSERLESLLVGYVKENGINWDVVRAVDGLQRELEGEKPMLYCFQIGWFTTYGTPLV
ncbi:hypothetical protein BJ508DRAFT_417953 [Ascobolus immersus RN42]|uniref:Uncharacterized protein n=1 Tax=Ascobolus immersus RN42 TaxID=1160509 RepID=A0A3N4HTD1_ASCIM|nr:hypothetical protein BJ508DRAFT_417953 [Ascobolus immersus RN42]